MNLLKNAFRSQGQSANRHLLQLGRRLLLPWIVGTLFLYILVHSPLRNVVAASFGMGSRGCYFCVVGLTGQMVLNGLAATWLILSALVAAWILSEKFAGLFSEKLLVFALLGLGFITIPASMIGEAADVFHQSFLRPPWGALFTSIPAVSLVVMSIWRGWRPHRISLTMPKPGWFTLLIVGLGSAMLVSSVGISLLHPATGYDSLSYHGPMAIFVWLDGSLGAYLDRAPGVWALAHPGTVEIWVGLLRLLGGEHLASLGQLPFMFLGCAAVYVFTRRLGLWQRAAQLAAASFLLMPMVVMQAGMQLNDLAASVLFMAAVALASAPPAGWKIDRLILMGIGLGLTAASKIALLPGVFIVGMFILFYMFWHQRQEITVRQQVERLAVLALSFLMVVAPWWLRNFSHFGNPVFPAALPFFGQGYYFSNFNKADLAFVPRRAAWVIYPFLELHDDLSGFGTLFAVCALPGFLMAAWRGRRRPLLLFGMVTVFMLIFWWFLSERFPRFLLALAGLSFAFIPWAILAIPRRFRRAGYAVVAVAAILSTFITFEQALLPFGRQPITRSAFYDQVWGIDPAVLALPESEGLFWQTGYAPDLPEYAAYMPLLGASTSRLVLTADQEATTESVVTQMRLHGIQYAYVTASPGFRTQVEKLYDARFFELVQQSEVVKGERSGARRFLYRPASDAEKDQAILRYLFRLR